MKPRVLLITGAPSPHLSQFLDALGQSPSMTWTTLFLNDRSKNRSWGCHLPRFNFHFAGETLGERRATIRTLTSDRLCDLVVFAHDYHHAESWYIRKTCRSSGIPLVFWNEPPQFSGSKTRTRLKRELLKKFLSVFAETWSTGPASVAYYAGIVPEGHRVRSLSYYIDLQPFLSLPLPQSTPGQRSGPLRLLYCGRLEWVKGPDLLIHACNRLGCDWHLDVVGSGGLASTLERTARAMSPERIAFHGSVPYEARAIAYRDADVLVVPSRHDGWGVVVLEALASGVPVLASFAVMAASELIQAPASGAVFEAGNVEVLARSIEAFAAREGLDRAAVRSSVAGRTPAAGAAIAEKYVHDLLSRETPKPTAAAERRSHFFYRSHAGMRAQVRLTARQALVRAGSGLHAFVRPRPGLTIVAYHFVLPHMQANFLSQMRWYRDHFRMVSVAEGLRCLDDGSRDPLLALSMDDCFEEPASTLAEALGATGVPCTFFVTTEQLQVRTPEEWRAVRASRFHLQEDLSPLQAETLRSLVAEGHHVGCHGHEHRSLRRISLSDAENDIRRSLDMLEKHIGTAPSLLAYPFGEDRPEARFEEFLRSRGVEAAMTIERGLNDCRTGRYRMKRQHVEGDWPLAEVQFFLLGAGDSRRP